VSFTTAAPRFVGQSVQRKEDPRLLTGRGTYVDDVTMPRMLHAAFLRSDVARARITAIDTSAARELPGVRGVYTADDFRELVVGPTNATMFVEGPLPDAPPLAGPEVRFAGEAIVLIVADSRYVAEDALELVEVEYDVLEPVLDPARAAADDSELVFPERGSNVMSTMTVPNPAVEEAMAAATHVVTETFRQIRQAHVPMETHGIVASWDPFEGDLHVWASSQRVHEIKATLSRALGIPDHVIHVRQRDVGGAFGQKGSVRPEEIAIVLATRQLGRPVKWIEDRRENLMSGGHARDDRLTVTMAVDTDGRIRSVRLEHLENEGAYPTTVAAGALVAMMFPGPYEMGAVAWSSTAVFTNTGARVPYRGPWNLESLAREQMMDHVARKIGLDPVEFRRRNVIAGDAMPYKNASGMTYTDIDPAATLEHALASFDYEGFRVEQRAALAEGRRLGVGFSLFIEPTALGAGSLMGSEAAHVRVSIGGKVSVTLGTGSHGQGTHTTMAQIAADELGVDFEDVVVADGDSDQAPQGGGSGGSRAGVMGGAAVHKAAGEVRQKIVAIAAHLLEAAPEDLELADRRVSVRGSPDKGISIAEIAHTAYVRPAKLPPEIGPGLEALARYAATGITWANACHVCVVEVQPTGLVDVLRYVISEDCGVMINPAVVHGQISGGVVQGIGAAFLEQFVYDDAGNPLTTTFLDYLIPTASDVPMLEIEHLDTRAPGPGGYKGVGEGGMIGSVPAVRNAISDAVGATVTSAVRPGDVYELMGETR
jgi:carbon-monoxide dehydrogenase large subunit